MSATIVPIATGEQTARCRCCPRALFRVEVQDGRTVCRPCHARLAAELAEVLTLWDELPACLAPGTAGPGDGGPRQAGPTGSRPSANLAVLSLLGGSVSDRLLAEEDAWRSELRKTRPYPLTPPRGRQDAVVRGCVTWLRGHLHWACHTYPDMDDLDRTLRRLLQEMRGVVTGDRRRTTDLAPACPMPAAGADETDADTPACGGTLTYLPRQVVIRCDTCRRSFGPTEWDTLGAAAGLDTLPFTALTA